MDTQQVIATLNSFQNAEDEKQVTAMLDALSHLRASPASESIEPLFRIFERFAYDDYYEYFWSILHTLERTPNYEPELLRSIARQPNEFNVLMISRMLNADTHNIGDTDLVDLLRRITKDERTPERAQELLPFFIQEHDA